MKKGIGILIRGLVLGGAEKQSLILAKLLQNYYPVYLFVQKTKGRLKQHLDFIEDERINYIQLSGNIISRSKQLIRFCKKNNIRIIYSYLTLDNILAAISSLFYKAKYIGGIRNCKLPYYKYLVTKLLQKFFFNYIIFNNQSGLETFVKKGFKKTKAILIHNCIKITESDEQISREKKTTTTILSIGRFTMQKDYYTSLKAIQILNEKNKLSEKIEYIIIGDGELHVQIKKWITELNLKNVRIVITPGDVTDYYKNADIYLITSIFEGLPNTIMEAQKYSLPVVATDVGDNKLLVENEKSGYLIEMRNYEKIAEYLKTLINDYEKRIQFGMNGFSSIKTNFSENKFLNKYIDLTNKLLKEEN